MLCCVRREGSGTGGGVECYAYMRRGVGTLGVFASGYLLVVGTPTALGLAEKALFRVETW